MTIEELKSILARFRIRPDKKLGQNFLLSEEVLDRIVEAGELGAKDRVLEIGPGLGFLTRRLAQNAGEVVAIEKDWKLVQVLRKFFKRFKNVKIIHGDALDPLLLPPTKWESKRGYKVIANIPYYLTGKVLQTFLQSRTNTDFTQTDADSTPTSSPPIRRRRTGGEREGVIRPSLLVLLLQKEVAQRIVAKPGEMSILSVSVQFYADSEIIAEVGKEKFYPVPEIESAIVRVKVRNSPRFSVDEAKFFRLVKMGFANKRKQLQNNLTALPVILEGGRHGGRPIGSRDSIASRAASLQNDKRKTGIDYKIILKEIGLNPLARAQDLSMEDWERLYYRLFEQ